MMGVSRRRDLSHARPRLRGSPDTSVGQPCPAETAAGAALLCAVEGCGCPVAADSSPTFRTERCPSTAAGTSTGMRGNEFCDESRRGPRAPGAPGQHLGGRVASER